MSKSLTNQGFDRLRAWLFPGVSGEVAPPHLVSDQLVTTLDAENWVGAPGYTAAQINAAAAPAGQHTLIAFSSRVNILNPLPAHEFITSDIYVQGVTGVGDIRMVSSSNAGGFPPLVLPLVVTDASSTISSFFGDPAQCNFGVGTVLTANLPQGINVTTAGEGRYNRLPNMGGGNMLGFFHTNAAVGFILNIMWVERRALGETPN